MARKPKTAAEERLLKAAQVAIKVYPYDWQECLKERKQMRREPCEMCTAQRNLVEAVRAVLRERGRK